MTIHWLSWLEESGPSFPEFSGNLEPQVRHFCGEKKTTTTTLICLGKVTVAAG